MSSLRESLGMSPIPRAFSCSPNSAQCSSAAWFLFCLAGSQETRPSLPGSLCVFSLSLCELLKASLLVFIWSLEGPSTWVLCSIFLQIRMPYFSDCRQQKSWQVLWYPEATLPVGWPKPGPNTSLKHGWRGHYSTRQKLLSFYVVSFA